MSAQCVNAGCHWPVGSEKNADDGSHLSRGYAGDDRSSTVVC